jgi:stage III sporulation protein AA
MPGSGKTTLLRDLIRQRSEAGQGSVAVVDERGELFPQIHGISIFHPGANTDVLTGCGKKEGIEILLRTMGPRCIAVDEITGESDASALLSAGWSGVELLATAHASSSSDLLSRDIYRPLLTRQLFQTLLIMNSDKTWHTERICL